MKKEQLNLGKELEIELNFYTVRSKDGKFLRAKKHSFTNLDTGKSWTDNILEAKIYSKIGPARSQCSWWAKNYPNFGIPDLILISTGKCFIVNEESRVKKQINKTKLASLKKSLNRAIYNLETHAAHVKYMRGDGKDSKSINLKKEVKRIQSEISNLQKEN